MHKNNRDKFLKCCAVINQIGEIKEFFIVYNLVFFRKTLAVPIVDSINWDNIEHHPYYQDTKTVGIFEWGFLYKEMQISKEDFSKKEHPSESSL